ncbi:MAG: type III-A CRISPR-associated protein Csm2 [Salinibacter sp.]
MQKTCEQCGRTFDAKNPNHRFCPECFQSRRRGGSGGNRPQLPNGYLGDGYFRDPDERVMHPELLTTQAEAVAQAFAQADVSQSQVRRYYTMVRSLKNQLDAGERFDRVANKLREMKANVAAIVGREDNKRRRAQLDATLKTFIDRNVDAAVDDEAAFLEGFVPHFQTVLAYFYYHKPS